MGCGSSKALRQLHEVEFARAEERLRGAEEYESGKLLRELAAKLQVSLGAARQVEGFAEAAHEDATLMQYEVRSMRHVIGTLCEERDSVTEGSECEALSLKRGVGELRRERDRVMQSLYEAKESVLTEQAENTAAASMITSLRQQLVEANTSRTRTEQLHSEIENRRRQEMRLLRDEYSTELHERDAELQAALCNRDVLSTWRGEELCDSRSALQDRDRELLNCRSELVALQGQLEDARSQILNDREHITKLRDLVSLCAGAGATRAAHAYYECEALRSA